VTLGVVLTMPLLRKAVNELSLPLSYADVIRQQAAEKHLDPALIAGVIYAETKFDSRVSAAGAVGLMQLMPQTAALLGVDDPFDPRENVEAGVRHLRSLMDRFDGNLPLVLAAYNAGERAVAAHRGAPPSRETRDYVKRVLSLMRRNQTRT
jgi:soluble lytic murein transglycosylase